MSDLKYLDFDVAIEPTTDGYVARVVNSPVGQAAVVFTPPFSDLEIENFLLRVGRSRHAVRRIESPEMASAKAFGGRLFDQVFAGEVRGCLRSSIDEASRQGSGLRVRLHLTKVPALADLPWEFLYNASMNRFFSLSVETPLVRYLELPERIRPLIVQPPLHVLMMISSPSDYPALDVGREANNMTEALTDLERRGLVSVERLEDATLSELQRRLRSGRYHIFHFVGHGGFDAQAEDGILIMEDQENRGRRVSAQFLGTLLHDHRPLRLAVLNACEGARASRGDPFAGTAQSLVQQGIPAVIAMQFEVTDDAAICFTREFYSAIAVGYPVDAALAEARKAIFAEVSEIEWGTPVLYMRSPDGRVFEIEQVNEATRKQLQISSLLSAARTAAASNDEAAAIAKINEVLALEPAQAEASAFLRDLARERELEELYAAARASLDARQWRDALDRLGRVQAINPTYRDAQALTAHAEAELAKAASDEQQTQQALALGQAARAAMAAGLWDDAISKWQALVALTPDDQLARAQLAEASRQQELATLYARGRFHADHRHWQDALVHFRQLQRLAPEYKDVAGRLAEVDRELDLIDDRSRPKKSASDRADRADDSQRLVQVARDSEPTARRPARWLLGGALGAAAVIAVLVLGAITIGLFISDFGNDVVAGPMTGGSAPSADPVRPPPSVDRTIDRDLPKNDDRMRRPSGESTQTESVPRRVGKVAGYPKAGYASDATQDSATAYDPKAAYDPKSADDPKAVVDRKVADRKNAEISTALTAFMNNLSPTIEDKPAPRIVDEPQSVTPQLRDALEKAIGRADEAEIQAFGTLNPAVLTRAYSGSALEKHVALLRILAAAQMFAVGRLHDQKFESFSISRDGRRAEVRLREVWSMNFHSVQTRQCIAHVPEHEVPQTLSLELTAQGWMITDAEAPEAAPSMVPCQ